MKWTKTCWFTKNTPSENQIYDNNKQFDKNNEFFEVKHVWNHTKTKLKIHKKSSACTKICYFWDFCCTTTKPICKTETTILWKFLNQKELKLIMKANDYNINEELKLPVKIYGKKNWNAMKCHNSNKSTWYWNQTRWYFCGKFSNDTFNIKKSNTTKNYMLRIPHCYAILLHIVAERQKRAFVTDAFSSTESLIKSWNKVSVF